MSDFEEKILMKIQTIIREALLEERKRLMEEQAELKKQIKELKEKGYQLAICDKCWQTIATNSQCKETDI